MAFGVWRLAFGVLHSRLDAEKTAGRTAMAPVLQAEADRTVIRRQFQDIKAEELIMSNVKGWKVGESVYNTDVYVAPVKPVKIGTKQ